MLSYNLLCSYRSILTTSNNSKENEVLETPNTGSSDLASRPPEDTWPMSANVKSENATTGIRTVWAYWNIVEMRSCRSKGGTDCDGREKEKVAMVRHVMKACKIKDEWARKKWKRLWRPATRVMTLKSCFICGFISELHSKVLSSLWNILFMVPRLQIIVLCRVNTTGEQGCWNETLPAERTFQLPVPSPDKAGGLASVAARL